MLHKFLIIWVVMTFTAIGIVVGAHGQHHAEANRCLVLR
jgi:hypothetical protein